MNKVTLYGRLAKDPQIVANGSIVSTTLAVDRRSKEKKADFIQIRIFGEKRVEFFTKYFKKGDPILIEGSLRVDQVQNNDGTTSFFTYVAVNEMYFTAGKDRSNGNNGAVIPEEINEVATPVTSGVNNTKGVANTRRVVGIKRRR